MKALYAFMHLIMEIVVHKKKKYVPLGTTKMFFVFLY
jgi:hypothetical protein